MTRTLTLAAVLLVLAGCGAQSADDDAVGSAATGSTPSPIEAPTVGTYPAFAPEDYAFTLRVECFCPEGGAPVRVTVVDSEVTSAVFARGPRKGEAAPRWMAVSIDDVIDAANDTTADEVRVVWPAGQDHPTSVWVDQDIGMADEERGYTVTHVVVGAG